MSLTIFRLVKSKYVDDAMSGAGARRHGGRWNSAGRFAVYTSETRALAALELLVHLGRASHHLSFVILPIRIPGTVDVTVPTQRRLPKSWREQPAPETTKQFGDRWLERGESAVLRMPSVVIPAEHNYVLNPAHAHFARVKVGSPEPFSFDPRLANER